MSLDTILGRRPDETLEDAANRVVDELLAARASRDTMHAVMLGAERKAEALAADCNAAQVAMAADCQAALDKAAAVVAGLRAEVAQMTAARRAIFTTDAPPDMPSVLDPERGVRWIVFIAREGGQAPTTVGLFSDREDAAEFFGTAGAQWSDSYLCEVRRGPNDGRLAADLREEVARLCPSLSAERVDRIVADACEKQS